MQATRMTGLAPRRTVGAVAAAVMLLLSLVTTGVPTASAALAPLEQRRAWDYARSFNINTHYSHGGSTYQTLPQAVQLAINLGVHSVRDRLKINNAGTPSSTEQISAFRELQAAGVKIHSTVGELGDSRDRIVQYLDAMRNLGGPQMFASIGGVNEPNKGHPAGWVQDTVNHQCRIWNNSADLRSAGVDVVGPSLYDQGGSPEADFQALADAGIGACMSHGDFHRYPRGTVPTNGLAERVEWSSIMSGGKPTYATETGYNTATWITDRGNPVSPAVQGIYLPRAMAEFFKAGVAKTFVYSLLDDPTLSDDWESEWGIVEPDGAPKPAYKALKYIAGLVKTAPQYPGTVKLTGDVTMPADSDMKYQILNAETKHYILVWRDVTADTTTTSQFKIVLDRQVEAKVHNPTTQSVTTRALSNTITVALSDKLMVIEIPEA